MFMEKPSLLLSAIIHKILETNFSETNSTGNLKSSSNFQEIFTSTDKVGGLKTRK